MDESQKQALKELFEYLPENPKFKSIGEAGADFIRSKLEVVGRESVATRIRQRMAKGRDPDRIPTVLSWLGNTWKHHPDMRLGQLLLTLCTPTGKDLFYLEDEELLAYIQGLALPPVPKKD